MKNGKILSVVLMALTVTSCGMANNLTSETFAKISTVSVSKEITGVTRASYYGAGENAAFALGGIIGSVAAGDSNMSKSEMLTLALKKNKIDLRAKVYQRFLQEIKNHELFGGKLVRSGSNATFHLEIYKYGLYAKGPFSSKMEPEVGIRATLKDKSGQKIWTNFAYVTALNFKGHEYTLEEYFSDPSKLNKAYDAAIEKAITSLMKSIKLAQINRDNLVS